MKKLLLCLSVASIFILFGCSQNSVPSVNEEVEVEVESTSVENTIKLSDSDISLINEILIESTISTAHEGSIFKITMSEKDSDWLNIGVIKPVSDIAASFNVTTADDVVTAIRKSLVFDNAYDTIKYKTNIDFKGMKMYIFINEEDYNNQDYYTLKTINNK